MVKFLTYNVYYKSMLGIHPICRRIGKKNRDNNRCINKISQIIEQNGPYHFVALQEAVNWQLLVKMTPVLHKMKPISVKYDVEEIVLFYHPMYNLDKNQSILVGRMADINRPFIICFFNNQLTIINIHAGHENDICKLDFYIQKKLNQLDTLERKRYQLKLATYDIILAGDFNMNMDEYFQILGRPLYGYTMSPTCCDTGLYAKHFRKRSDFRYDHILSTYPHSGSKVLKVIGGSDHLPVIADLKKNIGYDFDGVLHIDVGKMDKNLQRHPIHMGPYQPFPEIIKKINYQLLEGHRIHIITARHDTINNYVTIVDHLTKCIKKRFIKDIQIHFTNHKSKVDIISKYEINEYYDDSCYRLSEIQTIRDNDKLPLLNRVFLVIPEKRKWIIFDHGTLSQWCNSPSDLWYQLKNCYREALETRDNKKTIDQCVELIQKLSNDNPPSPRFRDLLLELDDAMKNKESDDIINRIQLSIIKEFIKSKNKSYN